VGHANATAPINPVLCILGKSERYIVDHYVQHLQIAKYRTQTFEQNGRPDDDNQHLAIGETPIEDSVQHSPLQPTIFVDYS